MFSFRQMRVDDCQMVGHWRTQPMVQKYMFTTFRYDENRQIAWFEKISKDPRRKYWIVNCDKPIGVISLSNINHVHHWSHFEIFIGDLDYWNMGGLVCPAFYNYIFGPSPLKLNKLLAEVLSHNIRIRHLHTYYGFREVGFLNNHVFKNGAYHDVVIYELQRKEWERNAQKYSSIRGTWHD